MSTASADRLRTRAAVLAALVAAHAGVVLIGWAAGWPLFLVPSPSFIPMAPTTALAFLALSLALVARLVAPARSPLRNAGTVLAWVAATRSRWHYIGALATIAAIVGATVALGYAYGTPLLYGGGTIPVALPTGLSLLI